MTCNGYEPIPRSQHGSSEDSGPESPPKVALNSNYRGFVAGIFSGIAKLSGQLHSLPNVPNARLTPCSWPSVSMLAVILACTLGHYSYTTRFDTIKVRLQTTQEAQFRGPLDCLLQTIRKEGIAGLYKGATPPLVGWMFMDSVYEPLDRYLPRNVADRRPAIQYAWLSDFLPPNTQ